MQYEATYVNLRDSIDVVVAGELNQYYLGNYDNFNWLGILDEKSKENYRINHTFAKTI